MGWPLWVLRVWVGLTGVAGLGASISAFTKPESANLIYERLPYSPPFARMYGTWLLLSTFIRVMFAIDPHSKSMFFCVFWTYIVALYHFGAEIFVFQTVPIAPGGRLPLIVASTSIVVLLVSYFSGLLKEPNQDGDKKTK